MFDIENSSNTVSLQQQDRTPPDTVIKQNRNHDQELMNQTNAALELYCIILL